jgi:hypothetical protein
MMRQERGLGASGRFSRPCASGGPRRAPGQGHSNGVSGSGHWWRSTGRSMQVSSQMRSADFVAQLHFDPLRRPHRRRRSRCPHAPALTRRANDAGGWSPPALWPGLLRPFPADQLIVRDEIPVLDTWQGTRQPFLFGPLFDFTFARVARILAVGGPADRSLEAVAFWLPAVMGVAAMLPVWQLARAGLGRGPRSSVPRCSFCFRVSVRLVVGCVDNNLAEPSPQLSSSRRLSGQCAAGASPARRLARRRDALHRSSALARARYSGWWRGVLVLDALLAWSRSAGPRPPRRGRRVQDDCGRSGVLASTGLMTLKPVISFRGCRSSTPSLA